LSGDDGCGCRSALKPVQDSRNRISSPISTEKSSSFVSHEVDEWTARLTHRYCHLNVTPAGKSRSRNSHQAAVKSAPRRQIPNCLRIAGELSPRANQLRSGSERIEVRTGVEKLAGRGSSNESNRRQPPKSCDVLGGDGPVASESGGRMNRNPACRSGSPSSGPAAAESISLGYYERWISFVNRGELDPRGLVGWEDAGGQCS